MRAVLIFLGLLLTICPAEARRHRHLSWHFGFFQPQIQTTPHREMQILAHPYGCPARLFCACGAAVDLGLNPRTHMTARSYYQYPSASAAPNRVAVRPHHVFVLKEHVGGLLWLVADYNSGGHASRLHIRSIAGYSIRAPRG